jgi:hypothetical protein
MRRAVEWPVIAPGLLAAVACATIAMRMQPPAAAVAARCTTVSAVLLLAKLVGWVAHAGHRFQREERMVTFVAFAAIVLAWVGAQERIGEAAFDYEVAAQTRALITSARDLSQQIVAFLDARARDAPPPPQPASWEADLVALARFDAETVRAYEQRYGNAARTAHDLFTFRNMRDRDLDVFYRRPANAFQVRVIAEKLASLAAKLERETQLER